MNYTDEEIAGYFEDVNYHPEENAAAFYENTSDNTEEVAPYFEQENLEEVAPYNEEIAGHMEEVPVKNTELSLPDTGEGRNSTALFGAAMTLFSGLVLIRRSKKEKDKEQEIE